MLPGVAMTLQTLLYEVSEGVQLEGQLFKRTPARPGVAVLILHPYAFLGGVLA